MAQIFNKVGDFCRIYVEGGETLDTVPGSRKEEKMKGFAIP